MPSAVQKAAGAFRYVTPWTVTRLTGLLVAVYVPSTVPALVTLRSADLPEMVPVWVMPPATLMPWPALRAIAVGESPPPRTRVSETAATTITTTAAAMPMSRPRRRFPGVGAGPPGNAMVGFWPPAYPG